MKTAQLAFEEVNSVIILSDQAFMQSLQLTILMKMNSYLKQVRCAISSQYDNIIQIFSQLT